MLTTTSLLVPRSYKNSRTKSESFLKRLVLIENPEEKNLTVD
jgi:hypothetical protein